MMGCATWHKPNVPRPIRQGDAGLRRAKSPTYDAPIIMRRSRVKRAWLATEKRDKIGRRYIGQDNVLVVDAIPAREAEKRMLGIAEEEKASHSQIRLTVYERGEDVPFA